MRRAGRCFGWGGRRRTRWCLRFAQVGAGLDYQEASQGFASSGPTYTAYDQQNTTTGDGSVLLYDLSRHQQGGLPAPALTLPAGGGGGGGGGRGARGRAAAAFNGKAAGLIATAAGGEVKVCVGWWGWVGWRRCDQTGSLLTQAHCRQT
jgi:hypothetical protein